MTVDLRLAEKRAIPRRARTAREICEAVPASAAVAIPPGLAVYGAITELDAGIKKGKTTLLLAAVRCKVTGEPFLGFPTERDRVLYVSEQSDASLGAALKRAGLEREEGVAILTKFDLRGLSWPEIVVLIRSEANRHGAMLIVIDTLSGVAQLAADRENSSGDALLTMAPLMELSAEGFAIVLGRHDRKGGGEVGESARGSSAFGGAVDVIIAMRKAEGGQADPTLRVLETASRFEETPPRLVIRKNAAHPIGDGVWAETFELVGTAENIRHEQARTAVLATLAAGAPLSTVELIAALKSSFPRTTIQRVVADLEPDLVVSGAGRKGDPKRFSLKNHSAQTHSLGLSVGRNESTEVSQ